MHERALDAMLRPAVEALGYELVGVEMLRNGRHSLLRLYIDTEKGITVDDCERVSHQVSGVLDVEDPIRGEYTLEVSSPGLDRPLFSAEHYERFAGREVRVKLKVPVEGRRKIRGTLAGVSEGNVLVQEGDETFSLPMDAIATARLVPEQ